ncbi:hypothetical protein JCM10908_007105 [Rhodotorula pacifica]|uniref:uncharacterized protein n=1 Tax=Rhodotorula pacifica TaxID=1495444 RepID=UPI003172D4A3
MRSSRRTKLASLPAAVVLLTLATGTFAHVQRRDARHAHGHLRRANGDETDPTSEVRALEPHLDEAEALEARSLPEGYTLCTGVMATSKVTSRTTKPVTTKSRTTTHAATTTTKGSTCKATTVTITHTKTKTVTHACSPVPTTTTSKCTGGGGGSSKTSAATTVTQKPTSSAAHTTTSATTKTKTSSHGVTTSSSPSTCAPAYTAASMIHGTGTLPKPTAFVSKASNSPQLKLGNKDFTVVGPNIYWLCQDENYGSIGSYTDKRRVREALAIAVAMGANTVRLSSCGISTGDYDGKNPYNLEPQEGVFNSPAWDIRDYVLFAAREYGLRVILPLTDNHAYYHGGKGDFVRWTNASTDNNNHAFFTDAKTKEAFVTYVERFLTRRNKYTGVLYSADPTILAWETGNELGGYNGAEGYPPTAWTTQVASAIRKLDKHHLIMDGSNGFWNYTTGETSPGLKNSLIDIMSDHAYPRKIDILTKELNLSMPAHKALIVGEYDWTNSSSFPLMDFYTQLEAWKPLVGDLAWNVMGHDPQCCNYVKHGDGYSLYYPDGPNTSLEKKNILMMVQHWYKMTGRTPPKELPGVACPQPAF